MGTTYVIKGDDSFSDVGIVAVIPGRRKLEFVEVGDFEFDLSLKEVKIKGFVFQPMVDLLIVNDLELSNSLKSLSIPFSILFTNPMQPTVPIGLLDVTSDMDTLPSQDIFTRIRRSSGGGSRLLPAHLGPEVFGQGGRD
jgi:hypothetical protein